MKIRLVAIYMIIALLFFSCDNVKNKKENQHIDDKQLELSLEDMNRKMLQYESELIDNYIEKNNLKVIKTGTGLRYQIFNEGDGNLIKKGDVVTLEYELSLLSGELLYSSENDGNKVFLVSRGGVETGLEEAVLKLKNNSEAILILPSHLAHGLLGDGNKIPPKAILVYKIKVIDIK
jgi:FKBP-type peptidyl-prolyl cis-trans isomerase